MTHQAKRPYGGSQPSITSYFQPSSSPNYSLSSSSSTYTGNSPPLPANVQSNLLSVGMRVRKSVPEGYKTGTYAFNNISPNTTKPISTSEQSSESTASKPKTRPRAGNRELTPFCGILKVGGMAQQSWEIYNSPSDAAMFEDDGHDDDDDMPFLSSQGSTVSNYSIDSPPSSNNHNAQKRRFFDDEDEVFEDGPGMSTGSALALGERILAVPRRKKWNGKGGDGVAIVGQENLGVSTLGMGMGVGVSVGSGPDGDFEEADFLVMDEDDLEMSG